MHKKKLEPCTELGTEVDVQCSHAEQMPNAVCSQHSLVCEDKHELLKKIITGSNTFAAGVLTEGYDVKQGSSLMMGYLSASIYDKQKEYKHIYHISNLSFLN